MTKIAVFGFELEDFSAAPKGSAPDERTHLAESTAEAKRQLVASGRYSLVDTGGAESSAEKSQSLRNCGGCEAQIAAELGADRSLIGIITKISMTEHRVLVQIRSARDGQVMSTHATDLRIGAPYAWSRGVRWLMRSQILAH